MMTMGIEVLCSETALYDEATGQVTLEKSNRKFAEPDWFVANCVPGTPRSNFMEKSFAQYIDSERYIAVNEFFQVCARLPFWVDPFKLTF
jgi:hypothetical protein